MTDPFRMVMLLADLAPGTMRDGMVDGREIVVCRTKDGGVYALDNICSHAHARMCEGRLRGTRLICPMHGAVFDVRDGRPLSAPASTALGVHQVRLNGPAVEVCLTTSPEAPVVAR